MKKNNAKITIGIPTCYGGNSLVATVDSIISACKDIPYIIHIVADTNPIKKKIKSKLEKNNVKITWNKIPSGQFAKDKQIIKQCKTEILIITQDDIIFAYDLISKITEEFTKKKSPTMIVARVLPHKPQYVIERIIAVGAYLSSEIARRWNGGDNYLAANGRCMAFKTDFVKKLIIPDEIISGDAYLYFENKRKGGSFKYLISSYVKNKSPYRLKEHINQSKRFQNTKEEISTFINVDKREFQIPKKILIKSFLSILLSHSLNAVFYVALLTYSRMTKKSKKISAFWDIDISTKSI